MNLKKTMLAAAGILALAGAYAFADGIYPGFPLSNQSVLTNPLTGNETTAFDTHLANGAVQQTINVPTGLQDYRPAMYGERRRPVLGHQDRHLPPVDATRMHRAAIIAGHAGVGADLRMIDHLHRHVRTILAGDADQTAGHGL